MRAFLGIACVALCAFGLAAPTKWALVVGVDKYDQSTRATPLLGAGNDAIAIAKVLVETCGYPRANVQTLTSKSELQPTSTEILVQLENLARNAGPEDTVLFYFAGHGVSDDSGNSYLLPSNVDMRTSAALTHSALRTTEIQALLNGLRARTVLLMFDMCRTEINGGGREGTRALPASPDALKELGGIKDDGVRQVVSLFGCSPKQRSFEWGAKARGYFSWFLEQGLKGAAANPKGEVTIAALVDYLSKEVPKAVRDREGAEQVPYVTIGGPNPNSIVMASGFGQPAPDPKPVPNPTGLTGERATHAVLRIRCAAEGVKVSFQISGVEQDGLIKAITPQTTTDGSALQGNEVPILVDGLPKRIDPKERLPMSPAFEFVLGEHKFVQLDVLVRDANENEFVTRTILTRGEEATIDAILTKPDRRVPAISSMKQLTIALEMYMVDYDDQIPAAADTYTLFAICAPYFKNRDLCLSLNPAGGRILFNTFLANVPAAAVEAPSGTPILWDSLPWPDGTHLVAYLDSHVKFISEEEWQMLAKFRTAMWPRTNKFVSSADGQKFFKEQMKGRNNVHDPP